MKKQIAADGHRSIGLTGKGLLLTTLTLPHEEGDKILIARELAAKRLAQNGLRKKSLSEFTGKDIPEMPFVQPWMMIAQFIKTLTSNVKLAAEFTDWVYQKGIYSDEDSFWVLEETGRYPSQRR